MPELCRFYNIVIKMIFSDTDKHHKPHFHVYYNEYEASVGVDGELIAGSLPVKQLKLVQAWAAIHEDDSMPRGIRRCRTFRSAKSNR